MQDDMLDSHLKTITMIESEKLDLLEAAKDREGDLSEINTQLSEIISSNEELQREKVKCELRCVELEEQQDILQKEGEDLKETLSTLKSTLTEFESKLTTVQSEKSSLESQMEELAKDHERSAGSAGMATDPIFLSAFFCLVQTTNILGRKRELLVCFFKEMKSGPKNTVCCEKAFRLI